MRRWLWPARDERAADDESYVATNRAHDKVRKDEIAQRAQPAKNDQARERQQRRPARNHNARAANAKPESHVRDATRKGCCSDRLTLELSGGGAVRLERLVRRCKPHWLRCTGSVVGALVDHGDNLISFRFHHPPRIMLIFCRNDDFLRSFVHAGTNVSYFKCLRHGYTPWVDSGGD
jgi:hypothetical protein